MIDFQNVSKSFGGQDVLTAVSFRINDGERAGIVGPNGAGKSTIFKLITGEIEQDRGEIILPRAVKIGYLRQQLNPHAVDTTLLEYAEDAMPELEHMQREIDEIAHRLHALDGAGQQRDLKRLGELQGAFEHAGGYDLQHRAEAALCGLGFAADALGRPFREFSGGWQMRAELARTLVARPDILLLDEPSNYLDLPAVEWLKDHLAAYKGTLVLISHDRYLLTALTSI
ncbi:ABC-F family ATP-binding cassette domain-containing protein, partial [bacterium]|nr:ABC-F family ATP-binding cassette domain-containing protein [bacterium]